MSFGSKWEVMKSSKKASEMVDIERTKMSSKGQITIPRGIRHTFQIKTGQTFTFQLRKDGILLKPIDIAVVDRTHSEEWAEGLKAALEDVNAGRTRRFASEKEFVEYLDTLGKGNRRR